MVKHSPYSPQHQQRGQPHPQMGPPPPPPPSSSAASAAPSVPPSSSVMMTTANADQNGYYPPTATAAQLQGYPLPPPGVVSVPQHQPYPVQSGIGSRVHVQSSRGDVGSRHSGQNQGGSMGPNVSNMSAAPDMMNSSQRRHTVSGTGIRDNPIPYATVGVSKTSQPVVVRQTSQTNVRGSSGSVRGGGGASVLSKLPTSPTRQASVPQSGVGGSRPREVITVSSSAAATATTTSPQASSADYDQLPPPKPAVMQKPLKQPASYLSYQAQQANVTMTAPPPTKFTNVQLHQQYHQQYLMMQKQAGKTTPYQMQGPPRQRYQDYAQYQRQPQQQQQWSQQPSAVVNKSPPKYRHQQQPLHHGQPHNGHIDRSPSHAQATYRQQSQPQSQFQPQSQPQSQFQPQSQQPNNVSMAATSPQGYPTGRPLHMQVNDTSVVGGQGRGELVPRRNQSSQFQPQSAQAYDTLPVENDSFTVDTLDGSLASVTDELDRFTEEMSKALEQFDSLLQPQTSKPIT